MVPELLAYWSVNSSQTSYRKHPGQVKDFISMQRSQLIRATRIRRSSRCREESPEINCSRKQSCSGERTEYSPAKVYECSHHSHGSKIGKSTNGRTVLWSMTITQLLVSLFLSGPSIIRSACVEGRGVRQCCRYSAFRHSVLPRILGNGAAHTY